MAVGDTWQIAVSYNLTQLSAVPGGGGGGGFNASKGYRS